MSITYFWGYFGLPFPFLPRISMVIGDAIEVPKWEGDINHVPQEVIEDLHSKFMNAIITLFDQHKSLAGYPDAVLEIV